MPTNRRWRYLTCIWSMEACLFVLPLLEMAYLFALLLLEMDMFHLYH